jgi:hypothetical protein
MSSRLIAILFIAVVLAAPLAAQQALVCAPAPAGRPCENWHFHVQLYRPDKKQFVEIAARNPFATQAACDRARTEAIAANARVVEHFRAIRQQYEADRVGPCHCDTTGDPASSSYLPAPQRDAQLRTAEDIRLRVRERLLDTKLTPDSPVVRALWDEDQPFAGLGTPRFTALPQSAGAPVAPAAEELRATRTIDESRAVAAALDLPLVDIGTAIDPGESPAAPGDAAVAVAQEVPEPLTEEVVVAPAESIDVDEEVDEPADPAGVESDAASALDTAEKFVSYETQRIQNVLRAASAIDDETVKAKIFEACMQRIQLLSNLRLLIEGSGARSLLAEAARTADDETERLALIARLFGDEVVPHWAPADAADVILEIEGRVAASPEEVLRDTSGSVTNDARKRALYVLLARTQPTENQRLWLSSVIEEFLR